MTIFKLSKKIKPKQRTHYHIQKRTMYAVTTNSTNIFTRTLLVPTTNRINSLMYKKNACYEVDHQNTLNTNHKQSQANVIIQTKKGQTFQHSSFVRVSCEKEYCIHKECDKPCAPIVERADVGFATHNGTHSDDHKYLSTTDLNKNQDRSQYGKMHRRPIKSSDQKGEHKDEKKTEALNKNKEMRSNLHMNSSREPTDND